jgi:phage FluMu protein Com
MNKETKVRCRHCRKVIGILKKDLLEIKCSHCGTINQWDSKGKRVRLPGIVKKQKNN